MAIATKALAANLYIEGGQPVAGTTGPTKQTDTSIIHQNGTENSPEPIISQSGVSLAKAAERYAEMGWEIFPLKPSGKTPLTAHGVKDATANLDTVCKWWRRWPTANIGLHCGGSGLLVLDFDTDKDGFAGGELLEQLRTKYATATQRTGGGGFHVIYRQPDGDTLGNSRGTLPAKIDARGESGYIVLSPSIHPNGKPYQWLAGNPLPQPLPAFVLDMLRPNTPDRAQPAHINDNGLRPTGTAPTAADLVDMAIKRAGSDGRNPTGLWLACQLRDNAYSQAEAAGYMTDYQRAVEHSETHPYTDTEARKTLSSAYSKPARGPWTPTTPHTPPSGYSAIFDGDATAPPTPWDLYDYQPEDGGILDAWRDELAENWNFVAGPDVWRGWLDGRWELDSGLCLQSEIERLMDTMNELARHKLAEAQEKDEMRKARAHINATKRTSTRIHSVERMARAARAILPSQLDGGGNLLNFQNLTFDLDTSETHPHRREDFITHLLPYSYDAGADCPRWEQFCREIFVHEGTTDPDEATISLWQELVGYALTSNTSREVMVWMSGEGGNGKTVAITIIKDLLGALAMTVNFHRLGENGNYELADVPGKRLLFSTESERYQKIPEGVIKRLVSGETLNARPIYGSPFQFTPGAKIFWAANNMPAIQDTSNAIWRRLKLIPFNREFQEGEKDIHLLPKLRAELPGILNWAVLGLRRLRENNGFTASTAADLALAELKRDTNPIARWMDDNTTRAHETITTAAALYAN